MKDVINLVDVIQNLIFEFDIKTAMDKVSVLIENLILISSSLSVSSLKKLMGILNSINIALSNKDYLLYNDIMEYELKPFLEVEDNL